MKTTKVEFLATLEIEHGDVMVPRSVVVKATCHPGRNKTLTEPAEEPSTDFDEILDHIGEEYFFDDLDSSNKDILIDGARAAATELAEEARLILEADAFLDSRADD